MISEVVTPQDIAEVISRWTGIPVTRRNQTDRNRLLKLDKRLMERVIGQDTAIREATELYPAVENWSVSSFPTYRQFSLSWPDRSGKDRNSEGVVLGVV
jgi:hypothetical protein